MFSKNVIIPIDSLITFLPKFPSFRLAVRDPLPSITTSDLAFQNFHSDLNVFQTLPKAFTSLHSSDFSPRPTPEAASCSSIGIIFVVLLS